MWCIIQTWLHSALLNILSSKKRGEMAKDKPPRTTQRWEVVWLSLLLLGLMNKKGTHACRVLKKSSLIAFIKKLKKTAPSFLFLNFLNFSGIFFHNLKSFLQRASSKTLWESYWYLQPLTLHGYPFALFIGSDKQHKVANLMFRDWNFTPNKVNYGRASIHAECLMCIAGVLG